MICVFIFVPHNYSLRAYRLTMSRPPRTTNTGRCAPLPTQLRTRRRRRRRRESQRRPRARRRPPLLLSHLRQDLDHPHPPPPPRRRVRRRERAARQRPKRTRKTRRTGLAAARTRLQKKKQSVSRRSWRERPKKPKGSALQSPTRLVRSHRGHTHTQPYLRVALPQSLIYVFRFYQLSLFTIYMHALHIYSCIIFNDTFTLE